MHPEKAFSFNWLVQEWDQLILLNLSKQPILFQVIKQYSRNFFQVFIRRIWYLIKYHSRSVTISCYSFIQLQNLGLSFLLPELCLIVMKKAIIQTIYLPQKISSSNLSQDVRPREEINIRDIWKNDTLKKQPTRNAIFVLKTLHLASADFFSSVNNRRISRFNQAEIGCPLKPFFETINFFTDHCTGYSC